jgi:hypothetical protein
MVKVPLFRPMIFFGYLLHTKSTQNRIKCQILDNSSYDNFYGVGDFSHVYIIMYQCFHKIPKM